MDTNTREQVRTFILKQFYVAEPEALTDDASLLDQGIIDSTGVLEIVAFLERTYALKVEDEELLPQNLDSVAHICAFVARKASLSPGTSS